MSLLGDRLRRVTRLFLIAAHLRSGGRIILADLAAECSIPILVKAGVRSHYSPDGHAPYQRSQITP